MARLTVVYGAPQRRVVFPARAGDTLRRLGGGIAGVFGFSAALSSSHTLSAAFAGTFDVAARIQGGANFAMSIGATATIAGALAQTHHIAASMSAAGALTGDLEVTAGASDPAFRCVAVSYTGNGSTQAITGVGFSPELIIILDATDTTNAARWITQHNLVQEHWFPGGAGFPSFDNTQVFTGVSSFDADGFTLGSHSRTNASGTSYLALCFAAGEGAETANFEAQALQRTFGEQAFPHALGTTPVMIWSKRPGEEAGEWITDGGLGTDSDDLGGAIGANADAIVSVSATDFRMGGDARWNDGTSTGPLILFGGVESAGAYKTGTYTGTGGAGNAITGLGFQPSVVMIRSIDGTGLSILTGGLSPQTAFVLGQSGDRDAAFTLDADGFTVNGSGTINRSGETFRYFAWV